MVNWPWLALCPPDVDARQDIGVHGCASEEAVERLESVDRLFSAYGRGVTPVPPIELVPSLAPVSMISSMGSLNRAPCTWI